MRKLGLATALLAAISGHARLAEACGCFAQPSVATPVVQAGERILFAEDQGMVTAYIQIKYQGSADTFGWLVPLPSVPTLQLGTDEVFTQLNNTTTPDYRLTTQRQFCNGTTQTSSRDSFGGCGNAADSAGYSPGGVVDGSVQSAADMGSNEVVSQSSIGPFDYAVLHADDQTEMLNWLQTNKYFVPAGTDAVITPYIHPGAYFLALKLKAGESAGDIVPVIVKYASDLPMIPIILTSVGAVPDMGIQVWMLGQNRAIPRNYRAVVVDDMPIWLATETYESLLVRAIHETPMKHAWVTEYAGSSQPMVGVLDYAGRYGDPQSMKSLTDPAQYLFYLQSHGFTFDSTLIALLEKYLPVPAQFQSVPPAYYYQNYSYFQTQLGPPVDGGATTPFDPMGLTDDLEARIVQPTLATGALFRQHPYLTRLYTALSPEDMTQDPVFSENPDLPDVPLLHTATLTYPCQGSGYLVSDETGLKSQYPGFLNSTTPASLQIQTLREAGPPIIDTDNTQTIQAALGPVDYGSMGGVNGNPSSTQSHSGCSVAFTRGDRGMMLLFALALVAARWIIRRRRRVVV
jgi:hypothetical protein